MAEIPYVTVGANGAQTARYAWTALGDDDDGSPVIVGGRADGTIQFTGTFASATATLQGSNDGTNWVTMTDDQGSDIALTAAGMKMFMLRPWKLRVITAGGSGTDIDAFLLLGS